LGVLLLGAIVAVLLVVTSGGGTSHHAPPAAKASNAPTAPVRAVFKPSSVTVAVLNGTDVSQLAHKIGQQLTGSGYKEGALATAANQSQSTTVVGYLPGFKHDATKVATALKLSAANVQPVAQSAQTVACPPPGACHANVIVTVGSDLANG
jgi:hypothetical protein